MPPLTGVSYCFSLGVGDTAVVVQTTIGCPRVLHQGVPLPCLHSLQSNTIKDDGARSMAEALAANRTLSVIQ